LEEALFSLKKFMKGLPAVYDLDHVFN
jgi:hypothetical protein